MRKSKVKSAIRSNFVNGLAKAYSEMNLPKFSASQEQLIPETKFIFKEQPALPCGTKCISFEIHYGDTARIDYGIGQYIITDLDNNILQFKPWMKNYQEHFEKAGYKFTK